MLRLITYQVATQGFNSLLGLIYWAVAARLLTLGDVGRAAATLALIGLLAATSNLGFGTALIRHRYTREWDYPRLASSALLGTSLVAVTLSGSVAYLSATGADPGLVVVAWALVPMTVIVLACNFLDSLSLADNDGAGVLIRNQTAAVAKLLLLVLLVDDGTALVLTAVGALLLSAFVVWPRRRHSVSYSIAVPRLPSRFIGFALKQYVVSWLSNLPNFMFPILALTLLGPEVAGYVALAWGGASILLSAGEAAGTALLREESRDPQARNEVRRRSIVTVGAVLTIAVGVAVIAAPILTLFFGPRFDDNAIALFRLLALASLPYFIASSTVGRLQARDRSSGALVLVTISGLGGCTLLTLLVPIAGELAPGWAYLAANTAAAFVALWFLKSMRNGGQELTPTAPAGTADAYVPAQTD